MAATNTDTLPANTTVRYEGTLNDYRGLYGWVESSMTWHGQTRYNIALTLGNNRGIARLSLARRTSLVPGPNPG